MKAIKAIYDGKNVQLEEEIILPKNSKVIVVIPEDEDTDWYSLTSNNLNRAYSKNESKYLISEVKEPNLDYESR